LTNLTVYKASGRRGYAEEMAGAAGDFVQSFRAHQLWVALAMNDILARYRGSMIGPFWITITTAIFVAGIGLVYSELMNVDPMAYVPWMATGIVLWQFISGMVVEGADALISSAGVIRQTATPLPMFIWRVVLRGVINFAHQVVVIFGVAAVFGYLFKINLPMAVVGLVLIVVNVAWVALIAAIVSARFRDTQQVIASVIQLIFFLSPVLWRPQDLSKAKAILAPNPVFHMLEVARNPLLGLPVPLTSLEVLVGLAVVGWALAFMLFAAVRRRIVHYL
jgi:ABC-type polysaccharide/polyol phosphate export permease